jgi:hypothetical protein
VDGPKLQGICASRELRRQDGAVIIEGGFHASPGRAARSVPTITLGR